MLQQLKLCLATRCNTLHHAATRWNTHRRGITQQFQLPLSTHFNILQHAATHCNALQWQHTAMHCNALRFNATRCYTHRGDMIQQLQLCLDLDFDKCVPTNKSHFTQTTVTQCNTLQHTHWRLPGFCGQGTYKRDLPGGGFPRARCRLIKRWTSRAILEWHSCFRLCS